MILHPFLLRPVGPELPVHPQHSLTPPLIRHERDHRLVNQPPHPSAAVLAIRHQAPEPGPRLPEDLPGPLNQRGAMLLLVIVRRRQHAGQREYPPVVHGYVVYAVDVNGNVYAIDAESGAQIWHQALGEQVRAGPALSEDGSRLFVGSEGGKLDALDTADGFVVWSRESEGQVLSKPVVSGSTVYEAVVFGQDRIRALHVDNGRDIWTYPVVEEE